MRERRRFVRVRPTQDLPIGVALAGPSSVALDVFDVSTGGLAVVWPRAEKSPADGAALRLRLELPGPTEPFETSARVRWADAGRSMIGLELDTLSDDEGRALRRYVGALFERGGAA